MAELPPLVQSKQVDTNKTMQLTFASIAKRILRPRAIVLRDVLGIGAIKVLAMPLTLAIAIVLARYLGPEAYGRYAFVLSLLGLASLVISGGLSQLITREVALARQLDDPGAIKGIIRAATIWVLGASAAALTGGALLLLLRGDLVDESLRPVLITGFIALPILSLSPVWAGTLRGHGLGALSQLPYLLLMPLVQLVIVLLLAATGTLDGQSAMTAYVLANLIIIFVGFGLMKRIKTPQFKVAIPVYRIKIWARSSFVFTNLVLISFLNTQAGVLLLGFLSTDSAVGSYQIAERGAQFVGLTLGIIELVLAPHVAQHNKAGRQGDLQRLFTRSRRAGAAVALVIALPLIFFGGPIIDLLFGEAYVGQSIAPLAILSGALFFRACLGPSPILLTMSGYERVTLASQAAALLVTITLCVALIPSMGSTGAAWAAAAGTLVWSGLLAWQVQRRLGINILRL